MSLSLPLSAVGGEVRDAAINSSKQVHPVHSILKGCINYPGRQIASYEEQIQISGEAQLVHGLAVQSQRTRPMVKHISR